MHYSAFEGIGIIVGVQHRRIVGKYNTGEISVALRYNTKWHGGA